MAGKLVFGSTHVRGFGEARWSAMEHRLAHGTVYACVLQFAHGPEGAPLSGTDLAALRETEPRL